MNNGYLLSIKIIWPLLLSLSNQVTSTDLISSSLIRSICLNNIKREISRSQLIYHDNFANNICQCFVLQIKKGKSINSAKEMCKKEYIKPDNILSLNIEQ